MSTFAVRDITLNPVTPAADQPPIRDCDAAAACAAGANAEGVSGAGASAAGASAAGANPEGAHAAEVDAPSAGPPVLAALTTIGLGGPVRSVVAARAAADVAEFVGAADSDGGAVVLGGGSNLVAADRGVDLPVVRIVIPGVRVDADGVATIGAGVTWDDAVAELIELGWCGLAAMSGIPGTVGAAPVQNIGAYGIEIADLLVDVELYDRAARCRRRANAADLGLGYRRSVLKGADRAVVTEVRMRLSKGPAPVRYPELARLLGVPVGMPAPEPAVREAVLQLRRGKGMVLDPSDPDTRSCGSFFTNPIVGLAHLERVRFAAEKRLGPDVRMPQYPAGGADSVKLSAAWLIDNAGFSKGYPLAIRPDARIALSRKHTLAITNRGGGTTAELLALAREIRDGVAEAYGVIVEPEPVLLGCAL